MKKLNFSNCKKLEKTYTLLNDKLNHSFNKPSVKFFGMGSFHSKYVILGSGYSGLSLAKFLKKVKMICLYKNKETIRFTK